MFNVHREVLTVRHYIAIKTFNLIFLWDKKIVEK